VSERGRLVNKALLCCLAAVAAASAQTTSTITGVVRDRTGAVLPQVQVSARQTETGLQRSDATDNDGRFVLPALPVGTYEIRAEARGFRPFVQKEIGVTVGETAQIDFTMDVGTVDQEITVTARAPLVNTNSAELSYLVSENSVRELPLNGRNYTDLALLQPGVIAYPHRDGGSVVAHGLGMSINGQDPRSNVYLLDGTPQNDFTNGPAGSAAGTALGMETVREFRVQTNAYSAEFGRNSGGQINILTKSGTNDFHGSAYEFHRNDNLDARNFFDPATQPEFRRNQFGATLGGPIVRESTFFFFGYEGLRESLGRTIVTVTPDEGTRNGFVGSTFVGVNPAVRPFLDEFPLPNGERREDGLAEYRFGFNQKLRQNFWQGRVDQKVGSKSQLFARYTHDGANQFLPTDFPQFPRSFVSRNQFVTAEFRSILSANALNTVRFNFARTRIGQQVEANTSKPLQAFVPGRGMVGDIDIGGMPRFGPQSSVTVRLVQNVFGVEQGLVVHHGSHVIKVGALAERYRDNMVNPTFALGIYTFSGITDFLANRPQRFLGLTPEGALDRYWRFTLFGFYAQDDFRLNDRVTVNAGLRYEFSTQPKDIYGRDSALLNMTDANVVTGQLYKNPTLKNISPRLGLAWDLSGDHKTSLRAGYGWFFNTNNQQNLIVTVTNPPATPRISITNPTFPNPPFERGLGNTIRPVEWNLKNPNVHVWNANIQREVLPDTVVTVGYAGSRGVHLLRSGDVNVPIPTRLADGTLFFPVNAPRPNPAYTTIELKKSDGNSWYNALIFEVRKRWSHGFNFQSSYTFSRNIDTTQASTFFSDATNGTTSAMPEFPGFNYNKGLADYHAKHIWVMNWLYQLPLGQSWIGRGWELAGISQLRSGNPLTVFIQRNRSRSLWAPSLGPGIGFDRASLAPGRTHESAVIGSPDQYLDPTAFVLPPAGQLGQLGRGTFIGPDLRVLDLALLKAFPVRERAQVQFRVEAFNLLNRANFGPPQLTVFAGAVDNERPLSSFGKVRGTITSSRQIQLALRVSF
jgi:hypothetical protein